MGWDGGTSLDPRRKTTTTLSVYVTFAFSSRKARWQIPYNNKTVDRFGSGLSGCQCAGLNSERICVEAFRWCEVNSGVEKRLAMVIMRFRRVGFRLWDEYGRWMRCDDGLHSKWKVAYLRAYSLPAYSLLHAAASLWD